MLKTKIRGKMNKSIAEEDWDSDEEKNGWQKQPRKEKVNKWQKAMLESDQHHQDEEDEEEDERASGGDDDDNDEDEGGVSELSEDEEGQEVEIKISAAAAHTLESLEPSTQRQVLQKIIKSPSVQAAVAAPKSSKPVLPSTLRNKLPTSARPHFPLSESEHENEDEEEKEAAATQLCVLKSSPVIHSTSSAAAAGTTTTTRESEDDDDDERVLMSSTSAHQYEDEQQIEEPVAPPSPVKAKRGRKPNPANANAKSKSKSKSDSASRETQKARVNFDPSTIIPIDNSMDLMPDEPTSEDINHFPLQQKGFFANTYSNSLSDDEFQLTWNKLYTKFIPFVDLNKQWKTKPVKSV